jgi:hypothetical protein
MNLDSQLFGLASLGIVLSTFTGALIGLHVKNRVPGLGFRDGVRAAVYLTQYDAALEYHGLRRRELRARVDELRGNLAESAADGGLQAALARLGPPRALAAEVAGVRKAPSWLRGVLWVAGAVAIGLCTLGMGVSAFLGAMESLAAPGDTATWSGLLVAFEGTLGADGKASSFSVELPFASLGLLLVTFLVGARVWRLWIARRQPEAVSAGR